MHTFTVPKMRCEGCINTIKKAILQIDEAAIVLIDLPTKTVTVQTPKAEESIIKAMSDAGYQPTL